MVPASQKTRGQARAQTPRGEDEGSGMVVGSGGKQKGRFQGGQTQHPRDATGADVGRRDGLGRASSGRLRAVSKPLTSNFLTAPTTLLSPSPESTGPFYHWSQVSNPWDTAQDSSGAACSHSHPQSCNFRRASGCSLSPPACSPHHKHPEAGEVFLGVLNSPGAGAAAV